MKTQSKSVVASVVAALFAVAAFNIHAADQVKSGGSSDRPARALDAEGVKVQAASQAVHSMKVRSGRKAHRTSLPARSMMAW
jgi:hypothetical protein